MKVTINREKKIILLKWLKNGVINTLDIPELYDKGSVFLDLMKEIDQEESQEV